jgi:hypothetical protein
LNAFGLHLKKEETLAMILEENVRKSPAKPWISNRQIYVGSGTVLTIDRVTFIKSLILKPTHQINST